MEKSDFEFIGFTKFSLYFLVFSFLFFCSGFASGSYQFVQNKGQWPKQVQYMTYVPSGNLFIEGNKLLFNLHDAERLKQIHEASIPFEAGMAWRHHAFSVQFEGANEEALVHGRRAFSHSVNYFIGNDPKHWAQNAAVYRELQWQELYPKVDMNFYSKGEHLKYDLVVYPGGNPAQIKMKVKGLDSLKLIAGGLQYYTSVLALAELPPIAYQIINGKYLEVPCAFTLNGNTVAFEVGQYDTSAILVIDPDLVFSTFSGSLSNNFGNTATFDRLGNLYSGSTTFGGNYPTTLGAYDRTFSGGNTDIAISKFSADGSQLLYSTYVGGAGDEVPHSLIVDDVGQLYALATTGSFNFPAVNGFDMSMNGGSNVNLIGLGLVYSSGCDMAVFKLSANGNQLLSSTFLGGSANDGINTNSNLKYNYSDEIRGEILLDANEQVIVVSTTQSTDFNFGGNVLNSSFLGGSHDGVVVKLSNDLSQMLWGTYWGGNGADALYSGAVDALNNVYFAGGTNSTNYSAISFPFFSNFQGGRADGFIGKINAQGNQVLQSSYYGSASYDQIYFIDVDRDENIYVFGQTEVNGSPFQINAAFGQTNGGQFVTKFNNTLSGFIWSSQFGVATGGNQNARPNISPTAFLVDICNAVYLAGWGGNTNQPSPFNNVFNNTDNTVGMPITADAVQDTTDGNDFYLLVLRDDASAAVYASFFGGPQSDEHVDGGTSRFDKSGKIYQAVCAGCGGLSDLFTTPNAYSDTNGASCNLAVFKYDFNLPLVVSNFDLEEAACAPVQPIFQNLSVTQNATQFNWFLNGNLVSIDTLPNLIFNQKGDFTIQLQVFDSLSCNLADTSTRTFRVDVDSVFNLPNVQACLGDSVIIGIPANMLNQYTWIPQPGITDTAASLARVRVLPASATYTLLVQEAVCVDTVLVQVVPDSVVLSVPADTLVCGPNQPFALQLNSAPMATRFLLSSNAQFADTLLDNGNSPLFNFTGNEPSGRYYFKAISLAGCEDVDSVNLTVNRFQLSPISDTIVCRGDSLFFTARSGQGNIDALQWVVNGTDTTNQAVLALQANQNRQVLLFALDAALCAARDTFNVELDSVLVGGVNDSLVCAPINTVSLEIPVVFGSGSFTVATDANFSNAIYQGVQAQFSLTNPTQTATYYYRLSNSRGCVDVDSFQLAVSPLALLPLNDQLICTGDTAVLFAQLIQGAATAYNWSNSSFLIGPSNQARVQTLPLQSSFFAVEVENADGCKAIDSILVTVSDLKDQNLQLQASADTLFSFQTLNLSGSPSSLTNFFIWKIVSESSTDTLATGVDELAQNPKRTTTYQLLAVDTAIPSCSTLVEKTVVVRELICGEPNLFVPNSFSPNDDGLNEEFGLLGTGVDEMNLQVFNRWGESVFSASSQSEKWDGEVNGKPALQDVYVYRLEVVCLDGATFSKTGNLTLLR